MQLKFKRLSDKAIIPVRAHPTDAGLDLVAIGERIDIENRYIEYSTGIACELPPGTVGLIFPRSSNSNKDIILSNAVGVIDVGYSGEIKARFKNLMSAGVRKYNVGDRIAQLVVLELPKYEIVEVDELTGSDRGALGFGSSGK